jgi:hypothetical protein
MSDTEALKAEIKKLSAKAMQLKMDLHDLSEELPQNWQSILQIAQRTYDAFSLLEAKRTELKALETEGGRSPQAAAARADVTAKAG